MTLKWPGVLDTFRVPKPGAAFYRSQIEPGGRAGDPAGLLLGLRPELTRHRAGPGRDDRHQLRPAARLRRRPAADDGTPDTRGLRQPPLSAGVRRPDRRRLGAARAAHRRLRRWRPRRPPADVVRHLQGPIASCSTSTTRRSWATAPTPRDSRFRALDAYGNQRPYVRGDVTLRSADRACIVGQNPFQFEIYGGVGGVLIRSEAGGTGAVTVKAGHPTLGTASVKLRVLQADAADISDRSGRGAASRPAGHASYFAVGVLGRVREGQPLDRIDRAGAGCERRGRGQPDTAGGGLEQPPPRRGQSECELRGAREP